MSTGTLAQPAAIRRVFDLARVNYFCGSCRSFVQAPPGCAVDARVPDSWMSTADGVRGVRDDSKTKSLRSHSGPLTTCASRSRKRSGESTL